MTNNNSCFFQHLNPAKAIGEIKKLLTGVSTKPQPVQPPLLSTEAEQEKVAKSI